jgi:hypothetical protein
MCCDTGGGSAPTPASNPFTDTLAEITKAQWARNVSTFQPLEDKAIQDIGQFNAPSYLADQTGKAVGDVQQSFDKAGAQQDEQLSSVGVNPADAKYGFMKRGLTAAKGLGEASAFTGARDATRTLGWNTLVGFAGKGDAKVNQAIGAGQAGGNIYANLQKNQMDWQNQNSDMSGVGSLVGTLGSAAIFASSKKVKTARRLVPAGAATAAMRRMPASTYRYKPGVADGGAATHVGPMAEDMKAATGMGDGKHIAAQDMMGLNVAATQELDKRVRRLENKHG